MTLKKITIHAVASALFAGMACIIYNSIYNTAMYLSFAKVINIGGMLGACIFASVLMALGYYLGFKWKSEKALPWINIIIVIVSFASIIGVLGFTLPLDVESPEMFPGLAIPMHFFPALAFLALAPFFKYRA